MSTSDTMTAVMPTDVRTEQGPGDPGGAAANRPRHVPEPPAFVIRPPSALPLPDLLELWRYRDLTYLLALRNFAAVYRMSVLGTGWAVVRPLVSVLIFTVIFGRVAGLDRTTGGTPYPLFVLAALLPWMFFATTLSNVTTSVVGNADMLTKVYFPRLVLPLSSMSLGLADLAVQGVMLAALMAFYGVAPSAGLLWLPLFVVIAAAAALGAGVWLTALNVRYRDVHFALPFLTQVLMYLCPIVYPATLVPEKWRALYFANPMAGVIEGFRWALTGAAAPDFGLIAISAAVTAAVFVSGLVYFARSEQTFSDLI